MAREAFLIVAQSARALAVSAHHADLPVHALDLCGDIDTLEHALSLQRVGDIAAGFDEQALLSALTGLQGAAQRGVVFGSGFEAHPERLTAIAAGRPLLGNTPEVVKAAKDPWYLALRLQALGIRFPELRHEAPADGGDWLCKRIGASGGTHVRLLQPEERVLPGHYVQRAVGGRSVSITFTADARTIAVLGCSEHWNAQPNPQHPFRYSGVVEASHLGDAAQEEMRAAAAAVATDLGLRGLCGIDFLLDGQSVWLVDINPRPPASFELYERGFSAFALHVQACTERATVPRTPPHRAVRALAVLYADDGPVTVPEGMRWPPWVADRPIAGTRIAQGQPLCTVFGAGSSAASACSTVRARMRQVEAAMTGGVS